MKHDMCTELPDFGAGRVSLEPVLVPRLGGTDEDDGYVMACGDDAGRNASDVVILSARDFAGEPLAAIELPVRVPSASMATGSPTCAEAITVNALVVTVLVTASHRGTRTIWALPRPPV